MSVPDWISAIGSPLCGILLDYLINSKKVSTSITKSPTSTTSMNLSPAEGNNKLFIFLPVASFILLITHLIFQFTSLTPLVGMALIGITYSLFAAALWPCVPHLVGSHQIATGYGLMTISLNIALFVFPLVIAQIRAADKSDDYISTEYFFIALSFTGVVVTLGLIAMDRWDHNKYKKRVVEKDREEDMDEVSHDENDPLIEHIQRPPFQTPNIIVSNVQRGRKRLSSGDILEMGPHDMDDDVFVRVVGDGVMVATHQTVIHHHHQIRRQVRSMSTSPTRHIMNTDLHSSAAGTGNRLRIETSVHHKYCDCASSNGGLSPLTPNSSTFHQSQRIPWRGPLSS